MIALEDSDAVDWHSRQKEPLERLRQRDSSDFTNFVRKHVDTHEKSHGAAESSFKRGHHEPVDMLDRFFEAKARFPEVVTDDVLWCYAMTNVVAGSDTVAMPLRTIFHYVLLDPEIQKKLVVELRQSDNVFPVSYKLAASLPYLDAIVMEALRIHPPVGLGLERHVPPSGLRLSSGFHPPWLTCADECLGTLSK